LFAQSNKAKRRAKLKVPPKGNWVYTAPSHQFPLGGTLSLARRFALLDWANKQEKWISLNETLETSSW
jgi:DNA-binding transcriptional MocR family regulator